MPRFPLDIIFLPTQSQGSFTLGSNVRVKKNGQVLCNTKTLAPGTSFWQFHKLLQNTQDTFGWYFADRVIQHCTAPQMG